MKLTDIFKKRSQPFAVEMMNPLLANNVGTWSGFSSLETDATSIACRDLIGNAVAGLTVDLYDRRTKHKVDHYLNSLIRNPNADEPRSLFFYNAVQDYFHGNVYLYLYKDNQTGQIVSMFRIQPESVTVERDNNNQKIYTFGGRSYDYRQILHIPSRYGYDGLKGKSIFEYAKNVFDVTRALDDYTNNSFDNSLNQRLVIDISKAFPNATTEQIEAIRAKYVSAYTGATNSGKPIVKSQNIDFTTIDSGNVDNRANQLQENRIFQTSEVSRLFGVPTSLLNGENKYGDVESLYQIFVDTAILPITNVFQQYFEKMLSVQERDNYYFEYNFNSLLKTDLTSRIEAYSKQLNNGMLSINEIRSRENLDPLEDEAGDVHFVASNLMPVRNDVIDSFMASAKLKQITVESGIGDDKK